MSSSMLLLVAFSVLASGTSANDRCRRITFVHEISGKSLRGHVIRSFATKNCDLCQIQCFIEEQCVSYNCGSNTCDLNSSDHIIHPADLVVDKDKIYHATENACKDHKCPPNATCLNGFTDKGYKCECTSGFTGDNCEKDIDECEGNKHGCSSNSTCINTVGSFDCKCSSGYHGDGVHCSEIKYGVAAPAQSCDDYCRSQNKTCVEINAFPAGSAVEISEKLHLNCTAHTDYVYAGHPCYNMKTRRCLGTKQIPAKIDCTRGGNVDLKRICPCADIG